MPEVAHLLGVGTDGKLYGTSAAGGLMRSVDFGISWQPSGDPAVSFARNATTYSFDPTALTTAPADADTFRSGAFEWGLSSQGVHFMASGAWSLHGLWACRCEGACGLKCNQ